MIGRSIGNYKIARVLGEGGMGTVYMAEHPMIGKRVAVKMLRPDLGTDPGLVSRFFQEAKAVNEIRHPNIVDISDFGHTEDGIVYFVMELMEGQSLRDRLSAGPLPIDDTIAVSRQVVDALAAAHRVGIIHRDLKPDNVFLVNDTQLPGGFRAKLFDFGVAKLLGDKQQQVGHKTIDGAVVGTPFYMAPEQALCHDVGAPADIYAMGVVIYEMLAGCVPFHSEQLVLLLNAILKQQAPPPSRARPETPPWLDRLVLRCLEKDPEARPRSMEEIAVALATGAAERRSGEVAALGSTMLAMPGLAPTPTTTVPRLSTARQATAVAPATASAPHTALADPSTTQPSRPSRAQGGMAGPTTRSNVLQRLRDYLDTRRVQRVAVPLIVVAALTIVASIFLSSAAKRPVTEMVPEVAPAPPPQPSHASIHINSEPEGAEVTRLGDNRSLGTTPVVDIRPADGRQVTYRFHLAGFTDVQMPFQSTTAGRFELTATLTPSERRAEPARASGGRRHGHERKQVAVASPAQPSPATAQAPPPPDLSPAGLPPLGDRNPVKRLRR